ncbi:unnamed protein product [Arabidopsis thaliana]|uniref:Zinc finger PHD-type domain-containing protein n=1 Tax=Arabidopsis thaliana TaxID=3702 RepID=A0A5S9YBI4_ARATH|nr:unnamed protein product [Arabidopsis thaliana]
MSLYFEGHEHHVSIIKHRDGLECDACDRSFGDVISCGECKFTVHRKCVFMFDIQEIFDHPSHDGHCLKLLTTGAPDHTDQKCHLCGKKTKRLLYHCSDCKLNVDIDCIIDYICARSPLKLPWHHHPLIKVDLGANMPCDFCNESGIDYCCPRCRFMIHERCASVFDSPEITHPSHVRHPLKLLSNGAPDYTNLNCHICGDATGNLLYHCDICKFNLNMRCAIREPTPVALSNMKVHEHTLTLMPRLISFVCDACGMKGDRAPYVCVQCDFMIFHQECAKLPRVIHVNHHDHRVSYKYPLGPGEWRCGVCWEEIDWSYGAYSCSLCPNYAMHSLCATRKDVWDGRELDGVLEEIEDIEPFKRNDDNTITHFTHEHNLSKDGITLKKSILCVACVCPIGTDTFYNCSESSCSFVLHETCANISKKKRHFLSPVPLVLCLQNQRNTETCNACQQVFCKGFIYSSFPRTVYREKFYDLLCSSITVPFFHGSHDHHLLFLKLGRGNVKTCECCGIVQKEYAIGCTKCNYFLDFRCATLPLTVRLPRYDDHPLTLCYGDEEASGKYWCDICERETNPKSWFYTCKDCGVTFHIFCVVWDIRFSKQGETIRDGVELLPNNTSSRPLCKNCQCRCLGPFFVKDYDNICYCSYYCYARLHSLRYIWSKFRCPPWISEPST